MSRLTKGSLEELELGTFKINMLSLVVGVKVAAGN